MTGGIPRTAYQVSYPGCRASKILPRNGLQGPSDACSSGGSTPTLVHKDGLMGSVLEAGMEWCVDASTNARIGRLDDGNNISGVGIGML